MCVCVHKQINLYLPENHILDPNAMFSFDLRICESSYRKNIGTTSILFARTSNHLKMGVVNNKAFFRRWTYHLIASLYKFMRKGIAKREKRNKIFSAVDQIYFTNLHTIFHFHLLRKASGCSQIPHLLPIFQKQT